MTRPSSPSATPWHFSMRTSKSGATLVELLIFMAVMAAVGISLLPLLFSTTEDRLLQQTAAAVEQTGQQLMQTIGNYVENSEKIVMPAMNQGTGSILHLQTSSGSTNPTVIGIVSGALILVQGTYRQTLSSSQVAINQFIVQNTSASASRQSVLVRFTVSRTIRLQAPRSYTKIFESVFSPFPDVTHVGDDCGCAYPGCVNGNSYAWQTCVSGECETAQMQIRCP